MTILQASSAIKESSSIMWSCGCRVTPTVLTVGQPPHARTSDRGFGNWSVFSRLVFNI